MLAHIHTQTHSYRVTDTLCLSHTHIRHNIHTQFASGWLYVNVWVETGYIHLFSMSCYISTCIHGSFLMWIQILLFDSTHKITEISETGTTVLTQTLTWFNALSNLTFPVRRLKFCAPYVVGVQQPMVSKKEQTLAVRRGWTATHGACNRSTPLAVRRGWTATHGFNEGKTLRRTSWVYSNPWFPSRSLAVCRGGQLSAVFITEHYLAERRGVV